MLTVFIVEARRMIIDLLLQNRMLIESVHQH
jgi:hypothetical protein